jgi:hypothetical protein
VVERSGEDQTERKKTPPDEIRSDQIRRRSTPAHMHVELLVVRVPTDRRSARGPPSFVFCRVGTEVQESPSLEWVLVVSMEGMEGTGQEGAHGLRGGRQDCLYYYSVQYDDDDDNNMILAIHSGWTVS